MEKVIKVENLEQSIRLDKYLVLVLDTFSRSQIEKLIDDNKVLVNGFYEKTSYKVKNNDEIKIILETMDNSIVEKENIPLDIVYEDDDVIVINKEAGMVVHPANGHHSGTLVNALLYHYSNLSSINGENRPGIVHRIDKDTSGLLIVAKNNYAHQILAEQFKNKTAGRNYIAICDGQVEVNSGIIDAPIGRNKSDRKKMSIVTDGKEARTHFRIIKRYSDYSLVECVLETGRTHQIRVHFKAIKHPLVGDVIYGPKTPKYPYLLLHAYKIKFIHPTTKEEMVFSCELPDYFKKAIDNLDKYNELRRIDYVEKDN